jgi:hypothetical protein
VEVLPMYRTSSMGSRVPPAVMMNRIRIFSPAKMNRYPYQGYDIIICNLQK